MSFSINENYGQVADEINNHAPVTFNLGEQTSESRHQAQFATDTGIHCNRATRETLEWLMAQQGFTRKELRNAWKGDTVFWSETEQRVTTKMNGFTYLLMGWGVFWLSAAVILLSTVWVPLSHAANLNTLLVYWAGLPVFLFSLWLSMTAFIQPYRTAQRVKRALDSV